MQTLSVPLAVLRDSRASGTALARTIAEVAADIERREAVVADLEGRLSLSLACKRLSMAQHGIGIQPLTEQLAVENLHLANVRRSLDGLRAIDDARSRIDSGSETKALAGGA